MDEPVKSPIYSTEYHTTRTHTDTHTHVQYLCSLIVTPRRHLVVQRPAMPRLMLLSGTKISFQWLKLTKPVCTCVILMFDRCHVCISKKERGNLVETIWYG